MENKQNKWNRLENKPNELDKRNRLENKWNKWNRLENKQNKWNGIELAGASSLIQTFDSIKNLTPTLPNYILIYLYLHYQTMRNVNDQQSKIIDKNLILI